MKRLMIYPLVFDSFELLRYADILRAYHLSAVVVLKEDYGFDRMCVQHECTEKRNIIYTDFQEALNISDTVLFLEGIAKENRRLYFDRMTQAVSAGKTILTIKSLYNQLLEMDDFLDLKERVEILDADEAMPNYKNEISLFRIDIPSIAIFSTSENADKMEILVKLKQYLERENYNVLCYSGNALSRLWEVNHLPEIVTNLDIGINEKIAFFNQMVYHDATQSGADIIIIDIPGGIIPYNESITNNFGELAFAICNALNIDIGIISLFAIEGINDDYLEQYKNCCEYRFNIPQLKYHFVAKEVEFEEDFEGKRLHYYPLKKNTFMQRVTYDGKNTYFNCKYGVNQEQMFAQIVNELSNNIYVV